jgi:hypothetical protein
MASLQKYSIVEFQKRLHKIQSLNDIEQSSYIKSVIYKLNQKEELQKQFDMAKSQDKFDIVKDWIFVHAAQSFNLAQNHLYQFIAENYLNIGQGISETFADFYTKFTEYDITTQMTKSAVSRLLSILGIKTVNKKVDKKTCAYLDATNQQLNEAYDKIGIKEDITEYLNKLYENENIPNEDGCIACGV